MRTSTLVTSSSFAAPSAIEARRLVLAMMTALAAGACSAPVVNQTNSALDQTVLGTGQSFAVLAGSAVTNTGDTTVQGNLGVDPGLSVTGFPPGLVTGGTIHAGDAVALQAQTDTTVAYLALAAETPTQDLTGQDLGGKTLTPGTYHFSSSAQLTGSLTLDALGDPNAVFVFQIGSTLTTASNSSVLVINGAGDCNIYWQVGSSATLGTTTAFKGNIIALTSVTLTTGAKVSGRAFARNGAVTMDTNDVSTARCTAIPGSDDAGVDAGAPMADAPTPVEVDAGTQVDAGADCDVDAPPPPVVDAGCDVDAPAPPPVDAACEVPAN